MRKNKKRASNRHGLQGVTLCISTTLVLILLGVVALFVQAAGNLSDYIKENLTVSVMLSDGVSDGQAQMMSDSLKTCPFTADILYISKEQAKTEQAAALGADPSEFLGFNPFTASLEIKIKADYANRDSLAVISTQLKTDTNIVDVAYQEDLMDKVNDNINRINLVLLLLAGLMTFVSFALINNTVRLNIYSQRFVIHTMKLVGASWGFIRGPFVRQTILVGLLAALIACALLGCGIYIMLDYEPAMATVITSGEILITCCFIFICSIILTFVCSYLSVNRFLKMTAEELYKI